MKEGAAVYFCHCVALVMPQLMGQGRCEGVSLRSIEILGHEV